MSYGRKSALLESFVPFKLCFIITEQDQNSSHVNVLMKNAYFLKLIAHKVTERLQNDKDLKWCCHIWNLASFEQIFCDKVV